MIRKLYQDRQLSSICTLSKWLLLISPNFFFYYYLKPRQFESGVLRFESIRKLTVDKTAIFNSVSVGIGPNDHLLRRLQRQLDKQIGRKLFNCLSNLFGSTQHIHMYLLCFREEYFWRNREIKRHQNAFKLPNYGHSKTISLKWETTMTMYRDQKTPSISTHSKGFDFFL